jgi:hypothetical protein
MWISTTLEATIGSYIIGSMTKGVHIYCNGVDLIAAHAAPIPYSLTGDIARRSLDIFLRTRNGLFAPLT